MLKVFIFDDSHKFVSPFLIPKTNPKSIIPILDQTTKVSISYTILTTILSYINYFKSYINYNNINENNKKVDTYLGIYFSLVSFISSNIFFSSNCFLRISMDKSYIVD